MSKYNIAIIGPKDVILGYKALGVTPFVAEDGAAGQRIVVGIRIE